MKTKDFFNWNGYQINKTEAWVIYQSLCDDVFGEDVIDIDCTDSNNAVLMHLMFANMFETFYENLKALLEHLNEKVTSEEDMEQLIQLVEQVADPYDGEQAYAKLVVWDRLWVLFELGLLDLDKISIGMLYETEEDKDPYELAEAHRLMVMEQFGDEIVNEGKHVVALVKGPWNSKKCGKSVMADELYYRALARRTFMEYLSDDYTDLSDVCENYYGDALVQDAIKHLNGIIVIDMTSGKNSDKVKIHSFENPNSSVMTDDEETALITAGVRGDEAGQYDDFESDNY